jgi:hypothetical protein
MLKVPSVIIEILIGKIQWSFLIQFLPTSLLGVCCNQRRERIRAFNESGMIRTQMGSTIDQKMVAVALYTLCNTTP